MNHEDNRPPQRGRGCVPTGGVGAVLPMAVGLN